MDIKKGLGFLLVIVLLVRAWVFFADTGEGAVADTPEIASASATSDEESRSAIDETGSTVRITEQGFAPHVIAVETDDAVDWSNEMSIAGALMSEYGVLGEPEIQPGETYTWQPSEPGMIRYTLAGDESVEGAVVVVAEEEDLFDGRTAAAEFRDTCSGCHGPQRGGGTGPALLPERLTESDDLYFDTIKNGRPGTVMPAWGGQGLTDEEIWMLVGYIRSQPADGASEWQMADVEGSREVLVSPEELPSEPQHDANLDNLMLITEREARSIAVADADEHKLVTHIDASYRAHGYVFHPTNERWAYNVGRDGWLFKIDLFTMQAVSKVRVGLDARGLAISDDGQYLIAGNYIPATAVILDAETLEPLKVIDTVGVDPDGNEVESRVCITSDVAPDKVGPYFIIALKEAGQVWRIDYSQPDFPIDKLENVGRTLHDGFLSPDNSRFYIASQDDDVMAVIDVENWELVDRIETGDTPHPGSGATWEANGKQYGATVHAGEGLVTVWDLDTNEIVGEIETSGPGLFIRSHENNPYVWADTMFARNPNRIYILDKETFEVVHVIDEGTQTLHPEFSADGSAVYISDWQENVVRVYDGMTFEKIAEIDGVETPTGIFNSERRLETLGH